MPKFTKESALKYHAVQPHGKIEVVPTKPYSTQTDLALAYSPGVAEPCLEIEKNSDEAYKYTAKGNLVAVISNGTAVLGLGNIGAVASKPVMEGKGLLFKIYGGINVFDIEVNEVDPDKFIETVKAIAPTFGGINLEDIKAPECFEIERRLKEELDIPVMHDDQHGTAIISSAALLNALEVAGKRINRIKLVVNGAGASAIACSKLYISLGVKKENILMCDSKGVISTNRTDLNETKLEFAAKTNKKTLDEAIAGADVFLGLSKANVLTPEMVKKMNHNPIVFALANPNPEISYEKAMASRPDIIFATGRSDYPNQVNNVLGFPYIFRGALDVQATSINEEMKIAAVYALASIAKEEVLDIVNAAYNKERLKFGRDYIIPKPLDPRLLTRVSTAVAKAAIKSGVARKKITNWNGYEAHLEEMMGHSNKLVNQVFAMAKSAPKRVVFCEGNHINMIKAAVIAKRENICYPILLGAPDRIKTIAKENGLDLRGIEIINYRDIKEDRRRTRYAKILADKKCREGIRYQEASEKMNNHNYFGLMMVETGDADALITGVFSHYQDFAKVAVEVVGIREGYKHFASMHIVQTKKGPYFLSDTLINRWPQKETLIEIAKLTHEAVKFFNIEPIMAMLSFSNFGAEDDGSPKDITEAVRFLHESCPYMHIDGEMQVNFALNRELRDKTYPFNTLKGKEVNTLIFPNLSSANIVSRSLMEMGLSGNSIGPIQIGLRKPVHFTDIESSVRDIVNLTAIATIDAIVNNQNDNANEKKS